MLHGQKDFSFTGENSAVLTPTGTQPLAGKTTTLIPAVAFWNNFTGRWVIRGGVGLAIPMNGSGDNLISSLAIGQTLTDHDHPILGDFTYYLSTVVDLPPWPTGVRPSVTLTPRPARTWAMTGGFLAGLPTPVTNTQVADFGMIFWFMKAW